MKTRRARFHLVFWVGALAFLGLVGWGVSSLEHTPEWGRQLIAIGVVGASLSALITRLNADIQLTLLICVVAAGLGAQGVNLWLMSQPLHIERHDDAKLAARKGVPGFDFRTPLQVVRDLRASGVPAQPSVYGHLALPITGGDGLLPLGGISTATTVLCNESGSYAIYSSDEMGFNNPRMPPKADLVVIGDSFAQGACVPQGQDIAGQFRQKGYAAVNLGLSGSSTLLELATLTEYGLPLSPKTVVWLYFEGNDDHELTNELAHPGLRRYLEDGYSQGLRQKQPEINAFWEKYLVRVGLQDNAEFLPKNRNYLRDVLTFYYVRERLGLQREAKVDLGAVLETILRTAQRRLGSNRQIIFVYVPAWETFSLQLPSHREATLAAVKKIGLPVIDGETVLRDTGDPLAFYPLRQHGHLTAEGYARLAEVILPFLAPPAD